MTLALAEVTYCTYISFYLVMMPHFNISIFNIKCKFCARPQLFRRFATLNLVKFSLNFELKDLHVHIIWNFFSFSKLNSILKKGFDFWFDCMHVSRIIPGLLPAFLGFAARRCIYIMNILVFCTRNVLFQTHILHDHTWSHVELFSKNFNVTWLWLVSIIIDMEKLPPKKPAMKLKRPALRLSRP